MVTNKPCGHGPFVECTCAEAGVVRYVEKRSADYEAHIEKTYREVWRWLKRELGDGFTSEMDKELAAIFNNPYDKS